MMIDHENKQITGDRNKTLSMISDGFDFTGWDIKGVNLSEPENIHTPMQFIGSDIQLIKCITKNLDLIGDLILDEHTMKTNFHEQGQSKEELEEELIDLEVSNAVDKIAELSFKYPDKVSKKLKGKVDKETTEGLLSADGAPQTITSVDGEWKKVK